MTTNTITADTNAAMLNQIAEQAMKEPEQQIEAAKLTPPSDTLVNLPGGYVSPTGEVIKTAEVRELTGRDEEQLGKLTSPARTFTTLLSRAVVSVGNMPATDAILDNMFSGDRDALLLGIFKATFGREAEMGAVCQGCREVKTVTIDVDQDINYKVLVDPVADSTFTVKGKKNEFLVTLPTGITQKEIIAADEKNVAEITTILLNNTVLEIDGRPVVSPAQIQGLGLVDRRKLVKEITDRSPGPRFEAVTVTCPDCDGEVVVPISLGALFRF